MPKSHAPHDVHDDTGEPSNMQVGDVLVARSSSLLEHTVSIVPGKPYATAATHHDAMEQASEDAEALNVDAWATEDQIHVRRISTHRPDHEDS
ncbi:hypothetical protein [Luteitalea sp.]|jgi:hypothetical protein|uniref:hypothetical protein n=1 Tax=Luteitalea sp. TaxID=2004800 RepID=UPI0037C90553